MPIDITELIIKAKVSDSGEEPARPRPSGSGAGNENDEKIKTIERSVEEVMEIIKRKNER